VRALRRDGSGAARRGLAGAVLLAALAAAQACAGPAEQRYEEELARTPPAAEHAVHAARLAELMRGLERLTDERLPQALDLETERARRAERVGVAARAVADSAAQIPEAADAFVAALEPAERAVFAGLAETLEARAQSLAEEAGSLSGPALTARLEGLRGVCDGCHLRFRIPR
jgi:hypothetical protein